MRTADDVLLRQAAGSALFMLLDFIEKHFLAQSYELMDLARVAASDTQACAWLQSPRRVGIDWWQLPDGMAVLSVARSRSFCSDTAIAAYTKATCATLVGVKLRTICSTPSSA
jgi:hypothetical protein